jgi:phenylalanyl-tRNA synthetase beta chain
LRFVTTYRGKPIPAGHKSVTFRLVFRDPQTTLRHEQVDPQVAAVVERLGKELGAQVRT